MPTTPAVLQLRPFRVEEMRWLTPNTYHLILKPVNEQSMFAFKAGQWVYLHLLNPDESTWARAAFSIASAPCESKEQVELAIKVQGDYTKKAAQLKAGDSVFLQGPFGVFSLRPEEEKNSAPLVFFAGGIGITPFRSILRELAHEKSSKTCVLFYSNKTFEDIAYYDEFKNMAEEWPAFRPIFILTSQAPAHWSGETRRLDSDMMKEYINDFPRNEYFMCGPPAFMDAVKAMLEAEGVDVKKHLRKELFG